jgi:acetyltransferase-like isoleucine patch superfamily enzyme
MIPNNIKRVLKENRLISNLFYYLKYSPLINRFMNRIFFIFLNSKHIKGKCKFNIKDAVLKNCRFDVIGENNIIRLEKNCKLLNVKFFIKGNNHTLLVNENCLIRNSTFWFEDTDCKIILGSSTTIEGSHIAVTEPFSKIEIGEDCMFSRGIDIRNGDSHSIFNNETHERINYAKDIRIGNKVWLGKNVEILKGVEIGDNSIIAIHSVVTKNVQANSIFAGNPAKLIKPNVYWDRKRVYKND